MKVAFLVICCILLAALCASAAGAVWVPKPDSSYEVKDEKIYYRRGAAGLVLEAVNSEAIRRYYEERGAHGIGNPLAHLGPEVDSGVIFLLTLINRTEGSVTFTPNYALLRVKSEVAFALDFTVLVGLLDQVNPSMRKILTNSIFHSPETLPANKVVSKFLIFPSIPAKVKEIRVDFDSMFFEDRDVRRTFYFVKRS